LGDTLFGLLLPAAGWALELDFFWVFALANGTCSSSELLLASEEDEEEADDKELSMVALAAPLGVEVQGTQETSRRLLLGAGSLCVYTWLPLSLPLSLFLGWDWG